MIVMLAAAVALSVPAPERTDGRQGPPRPWLCIEQAKGEKPVVPVGELVNAVRARIGRRALRVTRCVAEGEREPSWRLRVHRSGPQRVTIGLAGTGLDQSWEIELDPAARPYELSQTIALTAGEAVRPLVDALGDQLGLEVEDGEDEASPLERLEGIAPEEEPAADETAPQQTVDSPRSASRWSLGLAVGGRADFRGPTLVPTLRLAVTRSFGRLAIDLSVAGQTIQGAKSAGVGVSGRELVGGPGLLLATGPVSFGLRGLARLTLVSLSGGVGDAARRQAFWNGGVGLETQVQVWRGSLLGVRLLLGATLWWRPKRFFAAGNLLLEQSHGSVSMAVQIDLHI